MALATNLKVDPAIAAAFAKSEHEGTALLSLQLEGTEVKLRSSQEVATSGGQNAIEAMFAKIGEEVGDGASARLFLFKAPDAGHAGHSRWSLVSFVPEATHPKSKMLLAAARDDVKRNLEAARFNPDYATTEKEDLTAAAYNSWRSRDTEAQMTSFPLQKTARLESGAGDASDDGSSASTSGSTTTIPSTVLSPSSAAGVSLGKTTSSSAVVSEKEKEEQEEEGGEDDEELGNALGNMLSAAMNTFRPTAGDNDDDADSPSSSSVHRRHPHPHPPPAPPQEPGDPSSGQNRQHHQQQLQQFQQSQVPYYPFAPRVHAQHPQHHFPPPQPQQQGGSVIQAQGSLPGFEQQHPQHSVPNTAASAGPQSVFLTPAPITGPLVRSMATSATGFPSALTGAAAGAGISIAMTPEQELAQGMRDRLSVICSLLATAKDLVARANNNDPRATFPFGLSEAAIQIMRTSQVRCEILPEYSAGIALSGGVGSPGGSVHDKLSVISSGTASNGSTPRHADGTAPRDRLLDGQGQRSNQLDDDKEVPDKPATSGEGRSQPLSKAPADRNAAAASAVSSSLENEQLHKATASASYSHVHVHDLLNRLYEELEFAVLALNEFLALLKSSTFQDRQTRIQLNNSGDQEKIFRSKVGNRALMKLSPEALSRFNALAAFNAQYVNSRVPSHDDRSQARVRFAAARRAFLDVGIIPLCLIGVDALPHLPLSLTGYSERASDANNQIGCCVELLVQCLTNIAFDTDAQRQITSLPSVCEPLFTILLAKLKACLEVEEFRVFKRQPSSSRVKDPWRRDATNFRGMDARGHDDDGNNSDDDMSTVSTTLGVVSAAEIGIKIARCFITLCHEDNPISIRHIILNGGIELAGLGILRHFLHEGNGFAPLKHCELLAALYRCQDPVPPSPTDPIAAAEAAATGKPPALITADLRGARDPNVALALERCLNHEWIGRPSQNFEKLARLAEHLLSRNREALAADQMRKNYNERRRQLARGGPGASASTATSKALTVSIRPADAFLDGSAPSSASATPTSSSASSAYSGAIGFRGVPGFSSPTSAPPPSSHQSRHAHPHGGPQPAAPPYGSTTSGTAEHWSGPMKNELQGGPMGMGGGQMAMGMGMRGGPMGMGMGMGGGQMAMSMGGGQMAMGMGGGQMGMGMGGGQTGMGMGMSMGGGQMGMGMGGGQMAIGMGGGPMGMGMGGSPMGMGGGPMGMGMGGGPMGMGMGGGPMGMGMGGGPMGMGGGPMGMSMGMGMGGGQMGMGMGMGMGGGPMGMGMGMGGGQMAMGMGGGQMGMGMGGGPMGMGMGGGPMGMGMGMGGGQMAIGMGGGQTGMGMGMGMGGGQMGMEQPSQPGFHSPSHLQHYPGHY